MTRAFVFGEVAMQQRATLSTSTGKRCRCRRTRSVAEQIAKLSEAFELKAGDIIYSGTPENVGPVVKGDVLRCKLEGLPDMSIKIT